MINLPPYIQEDLGKIINVANDLKMKTYIVGGFPRDLVAGIGVTNETDLDITEKNGNAFDLAFFVAAKYDLKEPKIYEVSGTALVVMPSGRMVEFHNAFHNVPHIIDQLYILGIEPKPINKDVYARDFTINTLLFDPDNGKILDITGRGIPDIKNKVLQTPLPARKVLSYDPRRILRGIRLAIQFDLKYDKDYEKEAYNFIPALIDIMVKHPNSKMIERTVAKAFQINSDIAYKEFSKFGLINYIPKSDELDKYIKEKFLGKTIVPVSINPTKKLAQTKMMQRLMEEREKHKDYIRRKRREKRNETLNTMEILEKARSGEYSKPQHPMVEEIQRRIKNK
jgi:hypothetical protein